MATFLFAEPSFVIIHVEDVTRLRQSEEKFALAGQALQKAHDELEQRVKERTLELQRMTAELDEANTALRVLLRKCDQERRELEEKVLYNAKQLILPYVKNLQRQNLNPNTRNMVAVIESHRKNIRTKLGLANRKENLRAFLLSFGEACPLPPVAGKALSWKKPRLKHSAKGASLAAAILEDRDREDAP